MLRPVPFLDLAAMHEEVREQLLGVWAAALDSSAFVGGAAVAGFERAFATYCGVAECVGVANGTDSLVLALRALGVGAGDEVVVPGNTFVATAEAVVLAGATPVFADVDPLTLLLTAEDLEDVLTSSTRAVIPVHLYGQLPDMDALVATARAHDLFVIEDAAQAHGATWRGRPAGSFGDATSFSFYPGKNLGALGDAGAVVTGDPGLAGRIRSLADHGRCSTSKYVHDVVGTNSRLDAVQAAALTIKLARLDSWNASRRAVWSSYLDGLRDSSVVPVDVAPGAVSVHHLAVVRADDRDGLADDLAARGIATGVHYPVPCHQQSAYRHFARQPLPVVEAAAQQVLSLPVFPTLGEASVRAVCEAVTELRPAGLVEARLPRQRAPEPVSEPDAVRQHPSGHPVPQVQQ